MVVGEGITVKGGGDTLDLVFFDIGINIHMVARTMMP